VCCVWYVERCANWVRCQEVGEGGGCGRGCACGKELRRTVTGVGCLLLPEVLVSTHHLGAVDGSSWGKPADSRPDSPCLD
jgi:hypothetical protein